MRKEMEKKGKFVNLPARKFGKTEWGEKKRGERKIWGILNHKSHFSPFFIHYDETGWVTATIPKPGFPTQKNLWKKRRFIIILSFIWTFPAWPQGCSQFANSTVQLLWTILNTNKYKYSGQQFLQILGSKFPRKSRGIPGKIKRNKSRRCPVLE